MRNQSKTMLLAILSDTGRGDENHLSDSIEASDVNKNVKLIMQQELPMLTSMALAVVRAAGINSLPIGTSMGRYDFNSHNDDDNILFDSLNNYESPLILMPSFPNPNSITNPTQYPIKSSPLQFLSSRKELILQLLKSFVNKINQIRRSRRQ